MSGTVIIADDDTLIRAILRSMLVGVGQNVFAAADGQEALGFAAHVRAELVMLDVFMPRLNGLSACEKIRALPGYANTPIVFLSAHDDALCRQAAHKMQANLFIAKPFQPAALLSQLASFLDVDPMRHAAILLAARRVRDINAVDSEYVWQPARPRPDNPKDASMLDEGRRLLAVHRA